jgi:hypothetical protein
MMKNTASQSEQFLSKKYLYGCKTMLSSQTPIDHLCFHIKPASEVCFINTTNQVGTLFSSLHATPDCFTDPLGIVNIWSHLLGVILFIIIGILSWFVFLAPLRPVLGAGDIAVFYVFILGAMVCLGMSSSFHCFLSHSEKVREKGGSLHFWKSVRS